MRRLELAFVVSHVLYMYFIVLLYYFYAGCLTVSILTIFKLYYGYFYEKAVKKIFLAVAVRQVAT